jgi:hypothetical protein
VRKAIRIVQVVLILMAVGVGGWASGVVIVDVKERVKSCDQSYPLKDPTGVAAQTCQVMPKYQVLTLSMLVLVVFALALMIGAFALNGFLRAAEAGTSAKPDPPAGWQQPQGPPSGQQQAVMHQGPHTGQQPPVPPGPGQYGPPGHR